jgi:hypothetical protein
VTKGISYSQALRFRRICSDDKSLKKRLSQLKNHLKKRGYKQSIGKKSLNKAHSNSRGSLFQYKEKQKCKRTHCVLTYHHCLRNSFNTICEHWASVEKNPNSTTSFLRLPWLPSNNQTVWETCWCGQRCLSLAHLWAIVIPVDTHTANVVDICNTRHRTPVKSPENSTTYFVLLIARVQILFTYLSVQFVASNTLMSLSSPSTHAWMDTSVTLQKRHFFLWASTSECMTTVSRILTEWKSSSLNRTVWVVIFNVRIGKDFGLKNSVFYIRTVLTENNRF